MAAQAEMPPGLTIPDFRIELKLVDPEFVRVLRGREYEAQRLMIDNHGINSPDYEPYHGEDPLEYGHINRVAKRNVAIMRTFFDVLGDPKSEDEMRERQEILVFAHYLGIIHDLVQNRVFVLLIDRNGRIEKEPIKGDWKTWIGKGIVKRERMTGQNEEDTLVGELAFMDGVDEVRRQASLPDLFSEQHRQVVTRAVKVTVPAWDGATVFQPNLEPGDSELTHSTAWADLKGIFMEGWVRFFEEGDLNLLADYPDILEVVLHPDHYKDQIKEGIGDRIRKWRGDQISFAQAQWDQLQEQIARFPKAEALLRARNFSEATFNDTFDRLKARVSTDRNTPNIQLLAELNKYPEREQGRYPRVA